MTQDDAVTTLIELVSELEAERASGRPMPLHIPVAPSMRLIEALDRAIAQVSAEGRQTEQDQSRSDHPQLRAGESDPRGDDGGESDEDDMQFAFRMVREFLDRLDAEIQTQPSTVSATTIALGITQGVRAYVSQMALIASERRCGRDMGDGYRCVLWKGHQVGCSGQRDAIDTDPRPTNEHERVLLLTNIRTSAAAGLVYGTGPTIHMPERVIERKNKALRDILTFLERDGIVGSILRSITEDEIGSGDQGTSAERAEPTGRSAAPASSPSAGRLPTTPPCTECGMKPSKPGEIVCEDCLSSSTGPTTPEPFCKYRGKGDPPQECDYPNCGCHPEAPASPSPSQSVEEAKKQALCDHRGSLCVDNYQRRCEECGFTFTPSYDRPARLVSLDALIQAVRSDCDLRRDGVLLEAQGRAALAEKELTALRATMQNRQVKGTDA